MDQKRLDEILKNHQLWLSGDGGERADLTSMDLTCANLAGEYLVGVDFTYAGLTRSNLTEANLAMADLAHADFTDANLADANLARADLSYADFTNANLALANLTRANLTCANLVRTILHHSNLTMANLTGAIFKADNNKTITIKKHGYFHNIYRYHAIPIITKDGEEYVKLGCHLRSVNAWEDDFWNNLREFPNDGSEHSKKRMEAFQACLKWLEENR